MNWESEASSQNHIQRLLSSCHSLKSLIIMLLVRCLISRPCRFRVGVAVPPQYISPTRRAACVWNLALCSLVTITSMASTILCELCVTKASNSFLYTTVPLVRQIDILPYKDLISEMHQRLKCYNNCNVQSQT